MPHSDDFGLDDDDTEFLAVATQVEASQRNDFRASPRPTKKRRVSRRARAQLDGHSSDELEWSETDEEAHSPPKVSTYFQSTAPPPTPPSQAIQDGIDPFPSEGIEEYNYFPGELEPVEDTSRNSRFKIHVPENGGKFPDMIFTQTQHGLDENPAAFRGAVWKRPPIQPPPAFTKDVNGVVNGSGVVTAQVNKGINSYFRTLPGRNLRQEDDETLARRLQAEEDLDARRQYAKAHVSTGTQQMFDATQDLADLPEDAFSSSSPEKSPRKEDVIEISSQITQSQAVRAPGLRAPQNGLKQMTIFGQPATQDLSASQAAKKRHAWPLANRDEPPTHHKLDEKAMITWVYPTNLGSIRDYQYNIVSRSLFHNTLVALPTGLGKTFIAATVMLNYYRWTTQAQIVFMAPTKPLIAQQMEACYGIVGIPKRDTVLMTGETAPAVRAEEWLDKRVFFMTPQTVINDLRTGICDPKKLVLLVVDEAHKATGGYAYTEVIQFMRRFNNSFRVLALTATPGSTVEAVQAVIDNLGIARVELRTEQSLDIREYTHEKHTETEVFDFSEEQHRIMDLFTKVLKPVVEKLCSQNAYYSRDPMALTAYGLTTARQKWMSSDAGRKAPMPIKGMMNAAFTVLSSLAHSISLLKHHGIGPFYSGVLAFQRQVESGESKGKTAANIAHDENFSKMMSTIRTWTNNPEFIGHPKLEYLREIVLNHFLDAGEGRQGSDVPPSATRVMVFASYRDSTEDICRVLKRNEPMIRPQVFVGQAASKGQEGMNQKKQNEVIQDFKSGKFNTLIATSIGEEGLDIGTVDLIVCYDASSSPIRMLQRIGRTGRKRLGRVCLLLMKGKEEKDYEKAQDNYAHIQKSIADATKYAYRDDQSPRILPKEVKPVADKRPVEIPVENSQPVDLNEKKRNGRGKGKTKRPPKKFHMPDGVRTGFTKASRLGSDAEADSEEDTGTKRQKTLTSMRAATSSKPVFRKPSFTPEPPPDIAALPPLEDVLLTAAQQQELEQHYAKVTSSAIDGVVRGPEIERFPSKLRDLGATRYVRHGKSSLIVEKAMKALHDMDTEKCHRLEEALHFSDIEDAGPARVRLVSPQADTSATGLKSVNAVVKALPPPPRPKPLPAKTSASKASSRTLPPQTELISSGSETAGRSKAPPPKKPRGRPKKTTAAPTAHDSDLESELPALRAPAANKPTAKPRGRPRKKQPVQRANSYGSGADEGESSEPEPTPDNMRIGTQGIDLGSRDTSGEDEEEEPDSEDQAFIEKSDELQIASSSQPGTQAIIAAHRRKGGRLKKKAPGKENHLSDVEEIQESASDDDVLGLGPDGSSDDELQEVQPVAKIRKRRVVDESDDDE
ncbi:ATP-dependent DNA helicase mph1 [Pseudocercospora fuligena]|uniref:ATP-dependent DNA helicase n=1 Tax=Pseudocercospora fuligena TaxID=685502 RepID=A0A8H6RM47_9PEZI|nr:ATP-dependent DNA helicase mph1 [Pseudocercospora fuligena]